jgi:hypothetical protein
VGQKVVKFSDLSGKIVDDEEVVRLVITQHPDLENGPVEIEAAPDELESIEELALNVVSFDVFLPGEERKTIIMDTEAFNKLATDDPMAAVLKAARKSYAKPAGAKPTNEVRINYASMENAGKPHKGRTTDAEKQIVRDHLDAVNERLQSEGLRTIDLDNPEHVTRYGLEELVAARAGL